MLFTSSLRSLFFFSWECSLVGNSRTYAVFYLLHLKTSFRRSFSSTTIRPGSLTSLRPGSPSCFRRISTNSLVAPPLPLPSVGICAVSRWYLHRSLGLRSYLGASARPIFSADVCAWLHCTLKKARKPRSNVLRPDTKPSARCSEANNGPRDSLPLSQLPPNPNKSSGRIITVQFSADAGTVPPCLTRRRPVLVT